MATLPKAQRLQIAKVYTIRPAQARFGVIIRETDTTVTIRLHGAKGPYELRFMKKSKTAVGQRNNWWPLKYEALERYANVTAR